MKLGKCEFCDVGVKRRKCEKMAPVLTAYNASQEQLPLFSGLRHRGLTLAGPQAIEQLAQASPEGISGTCRVWPNPFPSGESSLERHRLTTLREAHPRDGPRIHSH